MTYPIDTEQYIAAMRAELGPNEHSEEMYRIIIPLVNDYYEDGRAGKPFIPFKSVDAELVTFRETTSKEPSPWLRLVIENLIAWCRRAYEQGKAGE